MFGLNTLISIPFDQTVLRILRWFSSSSFAVRPHRPRLALQMVLVLIFIIAVIMYRVLISIPLFQNTWTRSQASIIASMSAAFVNLVLIMALGLVYEKLAFRLTQWGAREKITVSSCRFSAACILLCSVSVLFCFSKFKKKKNYFFFRWRPIPRSSNAKR